MPNTISKTWGFGGGGGVVFKFNGFTGYIALKINWNNKILKIMFMVKISKLTKQDSNWF